VPLAGRSAITPWVPVVLWIAVIATLGGAGFEHQQTSRFIGPLLHWLFPTWSEAEIAGLHGWIRKGAHVGEYAVVAVLAARALWLTGCAPTRAAVAWPVLALVACVAAADEGRQATLAGRTGAARDVALDVAGGALGLALAPWIVTFLGVRRRAADAPATARREETPGG